VATDPDELIIDLTNATTTLHPEVPPWIEGEPNDIYQLFSSGSLEKAADLVRRGRLQEFKDGWWQVTGSELYTVQVIDNPYGGVPWTLCSCPNGTNRASRPTCYHCAAVLMKVLKEGPAEECSDCHVNYEDIEKCPNIKIECVDCCGCPEHSTQ
jgi:hypothetical protein